MMRQRLTERITIEAPTETKSATGAKVETWSTFAERWAEVIPQNSQRFERLRVDHDGVTAMYRIRGRLAVTPKMRVVHLGRTFAIDGMECEGNRPPESAELITLICSGDQ